MVKGVLFKSQKTQLKNHVASNVNIKLIGAQEGNLVSLLQKSRCQESAGFISWLDNTNFHFDLKKKQLYSHKLGQGNTFTVRKDKDNWNLIL